MDEFELRRIVKDCIREVSHLSQMQVFSTSFYQKNYFQSQIDERTEELIGYLRQSMNWYDENKNI